MKTSSDINLEKHCHFLITAPKSNSGKTLVSLALMRAFRNKGIIVTPFKCGPDFIDPIWHKEAAGTPGQNLDLFMMDKNYVSHIYNQKCNAGTISITEGVMGLFDGANKSKGSTAEIAEVLNIPIILVVDASAMAYSAAALLYGFINYSKKLNFAGVIFNKVNSLNHYSILQEACKDNNVESLGYFPKNDLLEIPSRHLGLNSTIKKKHEKIIQLAADEITKFVDLSKITELTVKEEIPNKTEVFPKEINNRTKIKIAIAKDDAFEFIYGENVKALQELGDIVFFSPIKDKQLPHCDFMYLPGGYPEIYINELHNNLEMRNSIRNYCNNRGATYAECGGMMYLAKSINYNEKELEMVDFLSIKANFDQNFSLGYRKIKFNGNLALGHEFHYSSIINLGEKIMDIEIFNSKNQKIKPQFFRKKNTIASYLHLFWGNNHEFVKNLMKMLIKEEKGTLN